MKPQRIHNSLALIYRALAPACPGKEYALRIFCNLYKEGYQDVDVSFIEAKGEWCMWDEDIEMWWPVSHWTTDRYRDVQLMEKLS